MALKKKEFLLRTGGPKRESKVLLADIKIFVNSLQLATRIFLHLVCIQVKSPTAGSIIGEAEIEY